MASSSPILPPVQHVCKSSPQTQNPPWIPTTQLLSKYPTLHHLSSCKSMRQLNQVHAQTITTGIFHDNFVASRILSFAALSPNGSIPYARLLFSHIHKPDIFTFNTLIRAYAFSSNPIDAILFYTHILESSLLRPDIHSFPLLLKACLEIPSLSLGKAIHSQVYKLGLSSQVSILNFLVQMYASCGLIGSAKLAFDRIPEYDDASWNIMMGGFLKCGDFESACEMFDEMPDKNAVSWSVMINGYVQNNSFKEGLELFQEMLKEKVEPNESVLVNALYACAHLGALELGKWIEGYLRKKSIRFTVRLSTSLIDMYSKCGCVDKALEIFDEMKEKNVLAWSAMIGGLAINGQGKDALQLFSQMDLNGVKPNEVTFIGVLNACSHSGLVHEGSSYFDSMTKIYGLKPSIHHYCCMVDLYGRAGLLKQAEEVIKSMPMTPNSAVLGALLNACRVHGNIELGERIGKRLIELEPNHSGRYVLLSNIYASSGRWENVADLRRVMRDRGISKTPGCSFIELRGMVHEFIAGDNSHLQSEEIYAKLDEMSRELKLAGYSPKTGEVLLDMDEEEKEIALCHHSEKLAIAFGFINTEPGATIRITKNLRVCADCHSATKLISKIYNREIVVRDRCRFHHFKNGEKTRASFSAAELGLTSGCVYLALPNDKKLYLFNLEGSSMQEEEQKIYLGSSESMFGEFYCRVFDARRGTEDIFGNDEAEDNIIEAEENIINNDEKENHGQKDNGGELEEARTWGILSEDILECEGNLFWIEPNWSQTTKQELDWTNS
ncbi:Pentatricopeptide repeat [Macleaya cordata]|uniref:Pentatricopeptide repeat n=1 Tax=Macleaya cordata TaxID=56857 RepID=A0A200QH92_MACCD|nr:Pentatricopeptide repeat [Macleaya cordata]